MVIQNVDNIGAVIARIDGANRAEIARTVGVNSTHIIRIFNGTRHPSLAVAAKIAIALGMSLDELNSGLEHIAKNA